jgi:phage-related protein
MYILVVLTVVFYKTALGRVPVLEWLREMAAVDRRDIGLDLLRVQENWPIGMPLCKSLGQGLWEVRSNLQGGRIARLVFCLKGSEVFILHGFFKTTQKTPQTDLDLARRRMKEVMS